jgi:hypothetical protein
MQVAQGWVVIGLSALGVTMTAAGIAVALYCHRQDRAKVAEIETGVARAAYAAAVATASQVQGDEWEEGMAQAIEAGATTGRGEGRVHVGLPRHRVVSVLKRRRARRVRGFRWSVHNGVVFLLQ